MLEVQMGRIDHLSDADAAAVAALASRPAPASLAQALATANRALPAWQVGLNGHCVVVRRAAGEPVSLRFVSPATATGTDYYDRLAAIETCAQCGWQGEGRELAMGDSFDAGAEYHCPACDHYFGFRAYPTADETMTDARADPADRLALFLAHVAIADGAAED